MKKLLFFFLNLFMIFDVQSQQIEIKKKVDYIIDKQRYDKPITEGEYNFIVNNSEPVYIIEALSFYQKDTLDNIRSFVAWKIDLIGDNTNDMFIKKLVIQKLLTSIEYEEPRSMYGNMQDNIIRSLASYPKDCFSNESRDTIRSMVRRYNTKSSINLIAGYLELKDLIPVLKLKANKTDSISKSKLSKNSTDIEKISMISNSFPSHLALARMGVKEEITYCMEAARFLGKKYLPNYFLYHTLKDIMYIRQPEFIDYLEELINDENFKFFDNDFQPHPGRDQVIQEYFVFSGSILDNFPKEKIRYDLTDEEKIQFVKQWLKENKGKYKINRDKF